jgi:hypothetical protein
MVRRTLQDALAPDKLAFIKRGPNGGGSQEAKRETKTTIDLDVPQGDEIESGEKPSKTMRRSSRERGEPEATEILDGLLVSVTIRLPRRTSQALNRAWMERKLINHKATKQDVVEEVLKDWLDKKGYLGQSRQRN